MRDVPQINNGNLSQWIPMIPAGSEGLEFCVLRRMAFATKAALLLMTFALYSVSAQAPQAPSAQPARAPAQKSEPDKKNEPPQKQPAAGHTKPHKVITNDDPEFQHHLGSPSSGGEITPHSGIEYLLSCDQDCERQAKQLLPYGPDEEADWQMQLVSARRDLAKDSQWKELLWQVMQQTKSACNLEEQRSRNLAPSGTDYRARVERAKQEQYFESMSETLRQAHDASVNRIDNRISEVHALFPVRAAMMQVQASRIADLDCEDLPLK